VVEGQVFSTPKEQLQDIIKNGVVVDIFEIDELLSLGELISEEAERINAAEFGIFFGSLQNYFHHYLILQAARIFEEKDRKFPTRSIPAAFLILRDNAETLEIEQRPSVLRALVRYGALASESSQLTDKDITLTIVEYFEQRLSTMHPEGINNAKALFAIKKIRCKKVVHPEAIAPDKLPSVTFSDIINLVSLAKQFVGIVGIGYFTSIYEDYNGRYTLSNDAKRSTDCLRKLLNKADVLSNEK